MSKIQSAVSLAVEMANDPTHGYSQQNRWGPDYDCSSFLIHVWQSVGVPVRDAGATYTGNMKAAFLACGFADVSAFVNLATGEDCMPGDILLNERDHVAMSLGNEQMVWASTSGGHPEPGDQTGREIRTGAFYSFPWDCCLRYLAEDADAAKSSDAPAIAYEIPAARYHAYQYKVSLNLLKSGDEGPLVHSMQVLLNSKGFPCEITGRFDADTHASLIAFQNAAGILADGECGGQSWAALHNYRV